jgi:hypothetical protein
MIPSFEFNIEWFERTGRLFEHEDDTCMAYHGTLVAFAEVIETAGLTSNYVHFSRDDLTVLVQSIEKSHPELPNDLRVYAQGTGTRLSLSPWSAWAGFHAWNNKGGQLAEKLRRLKNEGFKIPTSIDSELTRLVNSEPTVYQVDLSEIDPDKMVLGSTGAVYVDGHVSWRSIKARCDLLGSRAAILKNAPSKVPNLSHSGTLAQRLRRKNAPKNFDFDS